MPAGTPPNATQRSTEMIQFQTPEAREYYRRVQQWADKHGHSTAFARLMTYLSRFGQNESNTVVVYLYAPFVGSTTTDFEFTSDVLREGKWVPWLNGAAVFREDRGEWTVHT